MKNRIIAAIVGMSMLLTCSPVLANDKTIVKHVNDVKLEDKSAETLFNTSNLDIFNGNSKLGKPDVKLNKSSLENVKEKVKLKSKSN